MYMPAFFNDSLFDDLFTDCNNTAGRRNISPKAAGLMKTDIKEDGDNYELSIELPGYKKENVNAELKDGYLVVSATVDDTKDEKNDEGFIRKERYYGSMTRSFYVGKDIKEDDVKAKFENGVLVLDVPKEVNHPVEEKKFIAIEG